MIKIVIVGAGLIGPRHAQSVVSNPDTQLVGFIDPSPTAATIAQDMQTAHFASIPAMIESLPQDQRPDAAIVCTPNHTHVPIAQELLTHGIHILLEKPVSDTIESGQALVAAVQDPRNAHLKVLVGHHRRFNPYARRTKQLLDANSLGRPIAVNGLWTLIKPDGYFAPPVGHWRRDRKTGGGVFAINLVHDVDLLQYFLGPIVRVYAEGVAPQRAAPHAAEEGAALTLRFASGVVGTFLVCDATPSPLNFETGTGENPLIPKVAAAAAADCYRIFGTEASLSVPDLTRWSYDGQAEKSWNLPLTVEKLEVDTAEKPFDLQLSHFVDVIQGKAEVSCSVEDGLRALRVCQAARESLVSGKPVDLD